MKKIILTEEQYNRIFLSEQTVSGPIDAGSYVPEDVVNRVEGFKKLFPKDFNSVSSNIHSAYEKQFGKKFNAFDASIGEKKYFQILYTNIDNFIKNPDTKITMSNGNQMTLLEYLESKYGDMVKVSSPAQQTAKKQPVSTSTSKGPLPTFKSAEQITWRPKGYTPEEIQKNQLQMMDQETKIAAADGCMCDCWMGNCAYFCRNNKSSLQGRPCGNSKIKNIPGLDIKGVLGVGGYSLINKSIEVFNKASTHKNNIAGTFGWSRNNEKADKKFFTEGDIGEKLKNIKPHVLINPEYIGTLYQLHLMKVEEIGDQQKETLVANFAYDNKVDNLGKEGYTQTKPEDLEKSDKLKSIKVDNPRTGDQEVWYKVEKPLWKSDDYLKYDTDIPGTSSPDWTGGSWGHVPSPSYHQNILPKDPIKMKIRSLSEFEKQTKSYEDILNFMNSHNEGVLGQTTQLYNKICQAPTGYKTTYSINGKAVSKEEAQRNLLGRGTKYKLPTKAEACKWGKSGVWVAGTNNQYKYDCVCLDANAHNHQYMGNYGTISVSTLGGAVDVRSNWDQFVDSLTIHTLLQAASSVLVWFPPYGTAIAAGLEIIDGLIYVSEGEMFDAALSIGFSIIPALKPVSKIGKVGMGKVSKVLKGASELKDETKALQYITDNLDKLTKQERKALFAIVTNPDDMKKSIQQIENFNSLNKKDQWIHLHKTNPKAAKELKDSAKNEIWADMSTKEKTIYSAALGLTAPLTTDKSVGDKPQKDVDDELSKQQSMEIRQYKEGEPMTCMNCKYVKTSPENIQIHNDILQDEGKIDAGTNQTALAILNSL